MPLVKKFRKMNLGFGAIHVGAKVTQLGVVDVDAKPHVTWPTTPSWRWHDSHLGAVIIGAKLDAVVIGAKPGTIDLGVELLPYIS
jgi:hypothetical protein